MEDEGGFHVLVNLFLGGAAPAVELPERIGDGLLWVTHRKQNLWE